MDNSKPNVLTIKKGYTKEEWDTFVKGELIKFMEENDIEKITVDDGCGKKGRINKNKNGEYCVQVTLNEKM